MLIAFTALSAVIPSILLVWFFKSRDVHPEPSGVLWLTFLFGVLSIVPTLVVAFPAMALLGTMGNDPMVQGVGQAFFSAALPEEFFKLAVVILYASRHRAFDEPMDGIVYGVVASLGFATFENILYTVEGGLGTAILRAFTAVPMHAACGAIMGYYVGQACFPPEGERTSKAVLWLKAYLYPVLIHGLYDAPLLWLGTANEQAEGGQLPDDQAGFALLAMAFALFVLIVGVVWSLRLVSKLRAEQLRLVREGRFVLLDDQHTPLGAEQLEPPSPRRSSALGWVLIVLGFLIAAFGGLFFFVGIIALATDAVPKEEVTEFLIGCGVLSLPPLALGLILFVVGLRKLPKKRRRRSAYRR